MNPGEMAAIHAACFTTPPPWDEASITGLLAAPEIFVLTDVGGFALGRAIAGEAELLTIAVLPEKRRQGIAGRLLAAFEAEAAARKSEEAFLEVAADNEGAISLYLCHGYETVGNRPAYYTHPDGKRVDALIMRRALTGDHS